MRRRKFLSGAAAFMTLPVGSAHSNEPIAISGNRFRIGADEFQLADITAPSIYAFEHRPSAFVDNAKTKLQFQIQSNDFLFDDVSPATRWGVRIVRSRQGQLTGTLEMQLIADGAARVAPQTDNVAFIDRLLALENLARQNKTGLWSLDDYQVFDADDAVGAIGEFHLIAGKVVEAHQAGSRFYLNFGEDYRTDFTASTASPLQSKWQAEGVDLATLAGVQLRIRGFVNTINGPSIDLTHSRQIEVLNSR